MPRHKVDVPQDTMIMCARCQGNGVIGQRNGADVPCPACGGDGRIDSGDFRTFQGREERRYAAYESEPTFVAVGRETASVSLSRLAIDEPHLREALQGERSAEAAADDVTAGHVLVSPILGGGPQRFAVIGGHDVLAAAVRDGRTNVQVEVVATGSHRPVRDAVDLATFRDNDEPTAE